MSGALVTIVTPSLNQGRFIRATIESVLGQDYPHVEYIIMDGGSTDETAGIAAEYASRVAFVSEADQGQSEAINKGFRRGRGDILAWINSDDLLLPGAVSAAVAGLERNSTAAAVYGEGNRIDEHGRTIGRFPYTEPFNLWKLVHLLDYILQQTVYIRRNALDEVGYVDETLHYAMDWDLLIRLGKRYPLCYVPEWMGAIREYAAAKSFRGGKERVREITGMLRKHSGERNPPGARLYAIEAEPGRLPRRVINGRRAERLRRESQGLYRDGWAAPEMRYMAPPGDGPVVIRGVSPLAQELAVRVNGRAAGSIRVEPGPFEMEIEEPGLAALTIHATSSFRPASEEAGARRLAWVVRSIKRRDRAG